MRAPVFSIALFGLLGLGATSAVAVQNLFADPGPTVLVAHAAQPAPTQAMPVSRLPKLTAIDFDPRKLTPAPGGPAQPAQVQAATAPVQPEAMRVAVDGLNVRSGPSLKASRLFGLAGGAEVVVIERKGDWVLVQSKDGQRGWAFGAYLEPDTALVAAAE